MITLKFHIEGVSPLIMHNGELANPTNTYAKSIKEISAKRKKTDADHEEMARLEFLGGLYLHKGAPCIPDYVFEGCLISRGGAARNERMGQEAAKGLFVNSNALLIYDGPKEPDKLWQDKRFVYQKISNVKGSKVLRTRAIFEEWAADVEVSILEEFLNPKDVERWVYYAGDAVGLMDWRPRHGRFKATLIK